MIECRSTAFSTIYSQWQRIQNSSSQVPWNLYSDDNYFIFSSLEVPVFFIHFCSTNLPSPAISCLFIYCCVLFLLSFFVNCFLLLLLQLLSVLFCDIFCIICISNWTVIYFFYIAHQFYDLFNSILCLLVLPLKFVSYVSPDCRDIVTKVTEVGIEKMLSIVYWSCITASIKPWKI